MSNRPEDNDIDKLFRDSVDNVETEPSDRFWNRAYEGILKNENKGYERRLMIWRAVSVALALAVTGLIAYNVYTNKKVTNIEKQIATIEQKQFNGTPGETGSANTVVAAVTKNNSISPQDNKTTPSGNTMMKSGEHTPPAHNFLVMLGYNRSSVAPTHYTKASHRHSQDVAAAEYDRSAIHNIIYLDEKSPSEISVPPSSYKIDSAMYALKVSDSMYMVPIGPPSPAVDAKKPLSKVSVSLHGAPSFSRLTVKDNNTSDNVYISDIPANEQQQSGYTFGVNVGYDLNKNFTLVTGVDYRQYKYSIAPTTVDVTTGEWEEGYSFATSSGTVNMPYIPGYSSTGYDTTATASGRIIRSYVTVPVRLNYNIVHSPVFGIYATAGAAINVLAYTYATVHCQNAWGQEDVYMYNMEGTKRVNLSYVFGMGAKLKLGKGFEVYVEPSYMGSVTPNIKNSLMTIFSRYTDYTGGITYHF